MNYIHLSKLLSKALRHNPSILNLELDNYGSCDVDLLLSELRKKEEFKDISIDDLYEMMNHIHKKRFIIEGSRISVLYGHSIKITLKYKPMIPPTYLYHGTNHNAYQSIKKDGIVSMKRQYVHLSNDLETATKVALRTTKKPVILQIDALQAYQDGVSFYYANDNTYLCDYVDPKYICNIE